ncbi:ArnT family glycosyltransferase [Thalassotalea montiporae]
MRLISLGMYPLFDTTEARYGEMARLMVETGNWVTPLFDYNVPFWGKPPGHTWISAVSMATIGINEFAARLPHFVCGLLTLWLTYRFVCTIGSSRAAKHSVLVLATSLGFIVATGMVMTDTALLLSLTLVMTSYWYCFQGINNKLHGHLFFVGIALGMLIKGPVAVVIAGIALFSWFMSAWLVGQPQWRHALTCLPWHSGIGLCLLLTLPWYVMAEAATPGFLEYFIIGEHFQRFLVAGWQGDLYGSAHDEIKGTIWLFWLACAFPWSFWLVKHWLTALIQKVRNTVNYDSTAHHSESITSANTTQLNYFICWMLAPMWLFTLAGNILPAYVLPGFSAMAVYFALSLPISRAQLYLAIASSTVVILVLVALSNDLLIKSSDKLLWQSDVNKEHTVYYWQKRPFSAQFYSLGQAVKLDEQAQLISLLAHSAPFYLVVREKDYAKLSTVISGECQQATQYPNKALYLCN